MKLGPFGDYGEAGEIHSLLIEKGFNVELKTQSTLLGTLEYNIYVFEDIDERKVLKELSQYHDSKKNNLETSAYKGEQKPQDVAISKPSFVKDLTIFTIFGITFFWLLNSPLEIISLKDPTFQNGSLYLGESLLDMSQKESTLSTVPYWANYIFISSLIFVLSALFLLKTGNLTIIKNEKLKVWNFLLMSLLLAVLFYLDNFLINILNSELASSTDQLYFSGVIAEFSLEKFILGNTLFYSTFAFLTTIVIYGILIEKHSFIKTAIITSTFSTIALFLIDRPVTSLLYFVFLFFLLLIRKNSSSTLIYLGSYITVCAAQLYFFTALPILKMIKNAN